MAVQVYDAWHHELTGEVDDFSAGWRILALGGSDPSDPSVIHQHGGSADRRPAGSIEEREVLEGFDFAECR
jgi:hypothetical protein